MFEYVDGYLENGNDLSAGAMTLEEAKAAASVGEAIGFTWQGEENPKGKVHIYVKNSRCKTAVAAGAGWHTMLKQTIEFKYMAGFLVNGNNLSEGAMTMEEATTAASVSGAIGFTWQGEKDPKGKVHIYVKNSSCSTKVSAGADWHTMLQAHHAAAHEEPPAKRPRAEHAGHSFDPKYDFTMTFLDGTRKSLSAIFDGKPVLLYQYNAF